METQFASLKQDTLDPKQEVTRVIVGTKHEHELKMAEQKGDLVRWVILAMLLGVGYFLFSHIATRSFRGGSSAADADQQERSRLRRDLRDVQ